MKVIHLSLSAHGGAGIAAGRSVLALRQQGIDAELWTADESSWGPAVRQPGANWRRGWLDRLPVRLYRRRRVFSAWSNNWQPSRLAPLINRAKPAVVHLHWVGGGFLSLGELARFNAPVVWTLHDLWAMTGGCHYPDQCGRFAAHCGRCPQLASNLPCDLSWINHRRKRGRLRAVAAFISPSAWLAGLAAKADAGLAVRMHVIPNGLDGEIFTPGSREEARRALGLPRDAVVLLIGAHDLTEYRKGCHLLRETADRLRDLRSRCVWLMFGANPEAVAEAWPGEIRRLGTLRGESEIARACTAADLLLLPSLQDNLPNLALEAQASGCPVVGFDTGGLREIIEPSRTGLLAGETTASGLATAVRAWLDLAPNRIEVTALARARFEREFSLPVHGGRLADLYASLPARGGQR